MSFALEFWQVLTPHLSECRVGGKLTERDVTGRWDMMCYCSSSKAQKHCENSFNVGLRLIQNVKCCLPISSEDYGDVIKFFSQLTQKSH